MRIVLYTRNFLAWASHIPQISPQALGLDTFTLLRHNDPAVELLSYLNSRHKKIQFTIEFVQYQRIPFFDVLIKRQLNNSFSTSIYRKKKTFSGLCTQCDSFTPRKYKINLICTLIYCCLWICSSLRLLQSALDDLKKHLPRNGYPRGISYNVNDVVNKHQNKPKGIITVPKKYIFIVLPYLGLENSFSDLFDLTSANRYFWWCVLRHTKR